MGVSLVTIGSLVVGAVVALGGATEVTQGRVAGPDARPSGTPTQRVLVAVPDGDPLAGAVTPAMLATRLHVADPKAAVIVMLPGDTARTLGPFDITLEPASATGRAPRVRIGVGGTADLVTPLPERAGDATSPTGVTLIEVTGDAAGIVAHRTGRLGLAPDEVRMPTWRPPDDGVDAVAVDDGWWSLGPTWPGPAVPAGTEAPAGEARTDVHAPADRGAPVDAVERVRTRLAREPVSAMRRLVDVAVGDVTGDGTLDVALSFRRPYRRTLLNASLPRRAWTDRDGLSAHVGLYRLTDLAEIWVAGTLVRPVRRLAACTGALAVAYSTLRDSTVVTTSAWRWQGYAFLPLPELPGTGTPTCIDIDRDGRSEAAIIGRS